MPGDCTEVARPPQDSEEALDNAVKSFKALPAPWHGFVLPR